MPIKFCVNVAEVQAALLFASTDESPFRFETASTLNYAKALFRSFVNMVHGRLSTLKRKTYVIEWRYQVGNMCCDWTPLEGEEWMPESAASERLKYWQALSLAKLLEFRVIERG